MKTKPSYIKLLDLTHCKYITDKSYLILSEFIESTNYIERISIGFFSSMSYDNNEKLKSLGGRTVS